METRFTKAVSSTSRISGLFAWSITSSSYMFSCEMVRREGRRIKREAGVVRGRAKKNI